MGPLDRRGYFKKQNVIISIFPLISVQQGSVAVLSIQGMCLFLNVCLFIQESLRLRRQLKELRQWLQGCLFHTHADAFRDVPLDVLKERICRVTSHIFNLQSTLVISCTS